MQINPELELPEDYQELSFMVHVDPFEDPDADDEQYVLTIELRHEDVVVLSMGSSNPMPAESVAGVMHTGLGILLESIEATYGEIDEEWEPLVRWEAPDEFMDIVDLEQFEAGHDTRH